MIGSRKVMQVVRWVSETEMAKLRIRTTIGSLFYWYKSSNLSPAKKAFVDNIVITEYEYILKALVEDGG